jgi:hypothetical protein
LSARGWHLGFALAGVAGVALVLGIAMSRKALGAHSVAEIALGCMVGAACLYGFWRAWRGLPHPPMPLWPVYGALALLAFTMHETSFSPERQIVRVASKIRAQIRALDAPRKDLPPAETRSSLSHPY